MTTGEKRKKLWILNIAWAVLLIWLAVNWTERGYQHTVTVCPTKLLCGMPCPSCGLTRAFLLVAHGRFVEAVQMNINVLLLVPVYIAFPVAGLVGLVTRRNLQQRMLDIAEKYMRQWRVVVPIALFEITAEILNLYNHFSCGMP
ncbi:DUF2752 domain-containing protein [Prevotella sp. OH937_COT-195]|uniref:DUF2752 domain-containing protein n=1 Tax=Prevotella sp. OH937_COT-195 TaxID=2491051 RepID=UPI000F64A3EE|nr:DUF2752 domain-containing protein [Prevotella sp. OH937_COT-195]RRC98428.1 DUF2752 domain-containing protein [Prevotella sp. OH937_COT-195]